jgi:hypothetical protein
VEHQGGEQADKAFAVQVLVEVLVLVGVSVEVLAQAWGTVELNTWGTQMVIASV